MLQCKFGAKVIDLASTSTSAGTATVTPAIVSQVTATASTVWRTIDASARSVWCFGVPAASMARVRWKMVRPPRSTAIDEMKSTLISSPNVAT